MHEINATLWAPLALALAALAGCSHPCDSSTCFGCCDAAGECQSPEADRCGLNGGACQTCLGTQTCAVGVCQLTASDLSTSGPGGPTGSSGSTGTTATAGNPTTTGSPATGSTGGSPGGSSGRESSGGSLATSNGPTGSSAGGGTTAATGVLTGAVYSLDPSMPIMGATLDIAGPSPEVVAVNSADGTFSTSLAPGSYSILASAPGYANRPLMGIVVGAGSSSYVGIDMGEPLASGATTSTGAESGSATGSTVSTSTAAGATSTGGQTSSGRGSTGNRATSAGSRSTSTGRTTAGGTSTGRASSVASTSASAGATTTGTTGTGEGSGSLVGPHAFTVGSAMEFFNYLDGGAPDTSSVQFELIDAPVDCGDLAANGGHLPRSASQIVFGQVSNIIGFSLQGGSYTVPSQTFDTAALTYRQFFGDGGFQDLAAISGNIQLQGPVEEGVLSGSFSTTFGDASVLVGQFSAFYCDPSSPN